MKTIGATLPIRNCLSLDYCFEAAIASLQAFCDEIIICDGYSTDGTRERVEELAKKDSRIRILSWEWPKTPDGSFVARWNNFAREQLRSDMQFYLQADEVVHESSILELRRAAEAGVILCVRRLNFWIDHKHIIPDNTLCSGWVIRFGPQSMWMPEDGPMEIDVYAKERKPLLSTKVRIFHYGFIRRLEAFYAKQKAFQPIFAGEYGRDLAVLEAEGKTPADGYAWSSECAVYDGTHPAAAFQWLKEHDYD